MKRIYLLPAFLFMVACSSQDAPEVEATETVQQNTVEKLSRTEMIENIESLKSDLKSAKGRNKETEAKVFVDMSIAFAREFKGDSLAPEFLFVAGGVAQSIGGYDKAILCFNKVVEEYPNYLKRPESIFYMALVYDQNLSKKAKAKEQYERIIAEYPLHAFARDAEQSLKYLGMTNEEIIKSFENKE